MVNVRLSQIDLYHVAVTLRSKVKHASHERISSDNLVVRARLSDGSVGFGEGVPRSYVTGETITTTFQSLRAFDAAKAIGTCRNLGEVSARLKSLVLPETEADPRGMAGNAARCALELAVLDAFGHHFQRSIGELIHESEPGRSWSLTAPEPVRYSGAITAASARAERIGAFKMRLYGFKDVKLKVGVAGQDDASRLRTMRRILGRKTDIRIDANEAWDANTVVDQVRPLLPYCPSLLEQPLPHAQVELLKELRPRLGIPVMLDESLCGWPDAEKAVNHGLADFLNVRLSKCGGIFPSIKIMDLAWRNQLGVQLGCHPGETGILSAAGRQVASYLPRIRYLEGSYDRHVLAENLITEDITFHYGGKANPLTGPGLGITVDPAKLALLTVLSEEISYE